MKRSNSEWRKAASWRIENKRVAVDLARARQRFENLTGDVDYAEASLAVVLGYAGGRSRATAG